MKPVFAIIHSLLIAAVGMLANPTQAHAAAGDLASLNLNLAGTQVNAMALQPDGKVIIGGAFSQVFGVARANVARLNADGTLDASFDPKTNGMVNAVAVQADGKVLLGGGFTSLQPNGAASATTRYYVARLNADGSLDTAFSVVLNAEVNAIAVQADSKILVGGAFQTVNGLSYDSLVRLTAEGNLESAFQPRPAGAVYCLAVQPDGGILVGGNFPFLAPPEGFNGARRYVARLTADGWVDPVFDPRASTIVRCLALQADGKVLLGGDFTTLRPNGSTVAVTRNYLARVNTDGTLDTAFDPNAAGPVTSLAVQADGKIVVAGEFTSLSPNGGAATTRNRIARVNQDGSLESGFNPNANAAVRAVALQADGAVLVGGSFFSLTPNGGAAVARNLFARLLNDPATQTLAASGGQALTWTRGGTTPEVSAVAFELSVNNGIFWTALGNGVRTAGAWQRSGLSLPAAGWVRARARTAGGQFGGSSGIVEHVISLESVAAASVRTWAAGAGVPANAQGLLDDSDGDGLPNLLEFAFGTSPVSAGRTELAYSGPAAGGGTLQTTGQPRVLVEVVNTTTECHALFVRRTDHAAVGIAYGVSFSGNLIDWETTSSVPAVLADNGTYQVVRVSFPAAVGGLVARFCRVTVTTLP